MQIMESGPQISALEIQSAGQAITVKMMYADADPFLNPNVQPTQIATYQEPLAGSVFAANLPIHVLTQNAPAMQTVSRHFFALQPMIFAMVGFVANAQMTLAHSIVTARIPTPETKLLVACAPITKDRWDVSTAQLQAAHS